MRNKLFSIVIISILVIFLSSFNTASTYTTIDGNTEIKETINNIHITLDYGTLNFIPSSTFKYELLKANGNTTHLDKFNVSDKTCVLTKSKNNYDDILNIYFNKDYCYKKISIKSKFLKIMLNEVSCNSVIFESNTGTFKIKNSRINNFASNVASIEALWNDDDNVILNSKISECLISYERQHTFYIENNEFNHFIINGQASTIRFKNNNISTVNIDINQGDIFLLIDKNDGYYFDLKSKNSICYFDAISYNNHYIWGNGEKKVYINDPKGFIAVNLY